MTLSKGRVVRERVEATTRFELVHNGFAALPNPQTARAGSVQRRHGQQIVVGFLPHILPHAR